MISQPDWLGYLHRSAQPRRTQDRQRPQLSPCSEARTSNSLSKPAVCGRAIDGDTYRQELAKRLIADRASLTLAANEEQLIITTAAVLNDLADRTLRDRIAPLITDLSHRWKLLFGTEGLTLEPSGELVVRTGGAELSISDLSGGERATALLVTRLLVVAATTRIPTIWFDEPLEHLDPRRRAGAARTLVRAGQTKTVEQVIVTTYEERIVRQLAAADPDNVRVVHAENAPHP